MTSLLGTAFEPFVEPDAVDGPLSDYLNQTIAELEEVEGWTGWPTTDSEARDIPADFIDANTNVEAAHQDTVVALAIIRLLRGHSRS